MSSHLNRQHKPCLYNPSKRGSLAFGMSLGHSLAQTASLGTHSVHSSLRKQFLPVAGIDFDLLQSLHKVDCRKIVTLSQLVKQIVNVWQRKPVINGLSIQFPVGSLLQFAIVFVHNYRPF